MFKLIGYIDGGSASYLLAAVASGAAGLWFFVRTKVGALGRKGRKANAASADAQPSTDASGSTGATPEQ